MAIIRTSELSGNALDWAVDKCSWLRLGRDNSSSTGNVFKYSTDWAQGGPIIEREHIMLDFGLGMKSNLWFAEKHQCYAMGRNTKSQQYGETALIAAMRCYVASELGESVDIPDELA